MRSQRLVRAFIISIRNRTAVLFDAIILKCISVINFHVSVLISGKDWRTLNHTSLNAFKSLSACRFVQELLTERGHLLVQEKCMKNSVIKAFRSLRKDATNGAWMINRQIGLCRAGQLVKLMRMKHLTHLKHKVAKSHKYYIPEVGVGEVREYIQGGGDPLSAQVEQLSLSDAHLKFASKFAKDPNLDGILLACAAQCLKLKRIFFNFYSLLTLEDIVVAANDIVVSSFKSAVTPVSSRAVHTKINRGL